jgi:hypothetical protein
MKRSEIYLEAAKRIALRNDFSCNAIDFVQGRNSHPMARASYVKLFGLKNTRAGNAGRNVVALWYSGPEEEQKCRVLMLCLASAIAASEGE